MGNRKSSPHMPYYWTNTRDLSKAEVELLERMKRVRTETETRCHLHPLVSEGDGSPSPAPALSPTPTPTPSEMEASMPAINEGEILQEVRRLEREQDGNVSIEEIPGLSNTNAAIPSEVSQGKQKEPLAFTRFQEQREHYPYKKIYVALLSWEDHDLNASIRKIGNQGLRPSFAQEITELRTVFEEDCQFSKIVEWRIPSESPDKNINRFLSELEKHDNEATLWILYYSGHSSFLDQDLRLRITAWSDRPGGSPSLLWSTIQSRLESMDSDILLFLDSCESAGAIFDTKEIKPRHKRFEMIVGSGVPGISYGFIENLIEVLGARIKPNKIVTVVDLYRSLLRSVICENTKDPSSRKLRDLPATPIYISLNDADETSIPLRKLPAPSNPERLLCGARRSQIL